MRIAIHATYAAVPFPTGIGNYTHNLIRSLRLIDRKNKYTLFVRSRTPEKLIPDLGMPVERFVPSLAFLKRKGPDVFHDPAMRYVRMGRSRSVVTVHDIIVTLDGDYTSEAFKRSQTPKLQKAVKKADRIIAVSEFTKNELVKKMGADQSRISVVHHGIDRSIFRPASGRTPLPRPPHAPENYILFVGNIEKRKNITGIMEAFEKIGSVHKDLYLLLIGRDGYGAEALHERIRLSGAKKRIVALDYVLPGELGLYYRKARLLLFPSFYEGFGLPLLEAMACGCPVVTARTSSLEEVAGPAALYADPHSAYDIANRVLNLLEDPKLGKKLREEGMKRVENFSWESTARKTVRVYESACAL